MIPGGNIGVVGLGLLGGSLARALTARGNRVVAVEPDAAVRALALDVGAVAEAHPSLGPFLSRCELVILCAPVAAIEGLLGPVSNAMQDGAILTDVAGVKRAIVDAASAVRPGVRFVAAHPMFGGERGGFGASRADVFVGGTVAVCEDGAEESAIARVSALYASLGSKVVRCTADAHDAAVAKISHLPYVVAHGVFDVAANDALAAALAGPGFRSATRLSGFAFEVQGEVARRNPHLPAAIDALIARLGELRDALASSPEEAKEAFAAKSSADPPNAGRR